MDIGTEITITILTQWHTLKYPPKRWTNNSQQNPICTIHMKNVNIPKEKEKGNVIMRFPPSPQPSCSSPYSNRPQSTSSLARKWNAFRFCKSALVDLQTSQIKSSKMFRTPKIQEAERETLENWRKRMRWELWFVESWVENVFYST